MPNTEQIETLEYDASVGAQKVEVVGNTTTASPIRTTPGPVANGQTARTFNGRVVTSTTATTPVALGTVTAGKTYYISDIFIQTDNATPLDVALQAAGGNIFVAGPAAGAGVQLTGIATEPKATTAQAVTLLLPITTAAQTVWYMVSGYEQ